MRTARKQFQRTHSLQFSFSNNITSFTASNLLLLEPLSTHYQPNVDRQRDNQTRITKH
uniref:Uncharacterized protein n=1 Tax=Rhizophora mucronata TaxID=61149 RepID=A0A2P2LAC2_RHIMU